MGSIYRPKYKDRHGQERECAVWWIQYYSRGRKLRESTDTENFGDAKQILKQREGDATKGRMTRSMEHKVLFSELAALVEKDYELNGYRSSVDIELRHRLHILPYFGKMKATRISESDIDDYILQRRSEEASNVRLEPGTTKNREARQFPFTVELRKILEGQKAKRDALAKDGKICACVFNRKGKALGEFKHSWKSACIAAGLPGRLMHDFRRTAVRNLVRAGIPERVAMRMTGHKTRSVFERYNIVSEGDLRDAAARLDHFMDKDTDKDTPKPPKVENLKIAK